MRLSPDSSYINQEASAQSPSLYAGTDYDFEEGPSIRDVHSLSDSTVAYDSEIGRYASQGRPYSPLRARDEDNATGDIQRLLEGILKVLPKGAPLSEKHLKADKGTLERYLKVQSSRKKYAGVLRIPINLM